MDDLVKRLRGTPIYEGHGEESDLPDQAADRIEALEAEVQRLRELVPRPDQTQDEIVWRDHMRGVPLAALAKEFGVTQERMRHKLKRIQENRFRLAASKEGGA